MNDDSVIAKRKAIAVCNQGVVQDLYDTIAKLDGIAMTTLMLRLVVLQFLVLMLVRSTTKVQSPLGTRKYNKDAFIIIKNQAVVI